MSRSPRLFPPLSLLSSHLKHQSHIYMYVTGKFFVNGFYTKNCLVKQFTFSGSFGEVMVCAKGIADLPWGNSCRVPATDECGQGGL